MRLFVCVIFIYRGTYIVVSILKLSCKKVCILCFYGSFMYFDIGRLYKVRYTSKMSFMLTNNRLKV